jgi:hypothetical protein
MKVVRLDAKMVLLLVEARELPKVKKLAVVMVEKMAPKMGVVMDMMLIARTVEKMVEKTV